MKPRPVRRVMVSGGGGLLGKAVVQHLEGDQAPYGLAKTMLLVQG